MAANTTPMNSCSTAFFYADFPSDGLVPANIAALANAAEVTGVVELTPEGVEMGTVSVTHLKSPDCFKEKISGWGDGKTVAGRLLYTEARRAVLVALLPDPADTTQAKGRKSFYYLFPDGSYVLFLGFLKMIGDNIPAAEADDPIVTPFTIEVSGKPRWVAVTA